MSLNVFQMRWPAAQPLRVITQANATGGLVYTLCHVKVPSMIVCTDPGKFADVARR